MTGSTFVLDAPACHNVPDPAALLAAADADADAFADRLHDGALQALVVARYAADASVRGGDPALARDAVQEALVALRRAVWDLRPRGGHDLCAALDELSQHRVEAGAPALALEVDPVVAARLAPAARATAYRFVQAAAPPDRPAGVLLVREGDTAVLTAGAAPEDRDGWSARAALLGGSLDVRGSDARLLLPLDADPADPEDAR